MHTLRAARSSLDGVAETGSSPPREPYVQGVTASSAIVCWMDGRPGAGVVEYGKTTDLGHKETDARVGRRHAVALTDLAPGSTYHYRVEGVGENSRFSFAVVGDSGSGRNGQLAVAALLGRLKPDLILHTGDVVYPAGEERHYDKRFFVPYRHLTRSVPASAQGPTASRQPWSWRETDATSPVLEAEETIGGGTRSAQLTLPGYVHDVCSTIHPFGYAQNRIPQTGDLCLAHLG